MNPPVAVQFAKQTPNCREKTKRDKKRKNETKHSPGGKVKKKIMVPSTLAHVDKEDDVEEVSDLRIGAGAAIFTPVLASSMVSRS